MKRVLRPRHILFLNLDTPLLVQLFRFAGSQNAGGADGEPFHVTEPVQDDGSDIRVAEVVHLAGEFYLLRSKPGQHGLKIAVTHVPRRVARARAPRDGVATGAATAILGGARDTLNLVGAQLDAERALRVRIPFVPYVAATNRLNHSRIGERRAVFHTTFPDRNIGRVPKSG